MPHDLIFPIISILGNELQIFQKCPDAEIYDMCKTRDVLVFLIMLNTGTNVNALKQLFDHSFVVRCIVCGDAEQFLTQVKIHKHVEDIITKILPRVGPFEGMKCQDTVVQLEFCINPMHSNC